MIKTLSSIRLTFILLIIITLLMMAGILLSLSETYSRSLLFINETIVFDFLRRHWQEHIVLSIWTLIICLICFFLFINTAFCTITNQLKAAIKISGMRKWSFFIIHITFLTVLACHGITLVCGEKQSHIKLFPGQSHIFEKDLEIKITEIEFNDDIKLLKLEKQKARQLMTRENFHRDRNFARIEVYEKGREIGREKIKMLSPFRHGSLQITLTRFFYKTVDKEGSVGVSITITRNIFTPFFLFVYAVMIIFLILFIVITWHPQIPAEMEKSELSRPVGNG